MHVQVTHIICGEIEMVCVELVVADECRLQQSLDTMPQHRYKEDPRAAMIAAANERAITLAEYLGLVVRYETHNRDELVR